MVLVARCRHPTSTASCWCRSWPGSSSLPYTFTLTMMLSILSLVLRNQQWPPEHKNNHVHESSSPHSHSHSHCVVCPLPSPSGKWAINMLIAHFPEGGLGRGRMVWECMSPAARRLCVKACEGGTNGQDPLPALPALPFQPPDPGPTSPPVPT